MFVYKKWQLNTEDQSNAGNMGGGIIRLSENKQQVTEVPPLKCKRTELSKQKKEIGRTDL